MACFLSCISCCLLVLHQPSSSHHHVAPLLRRQQGGRYKGDKHTLIVAFSNVYVLLYLLSFLSSPILPLVPSSRSPSSPTAQLASHFHSPSSFVCSSSHVVVVMHTRDFFGDPGPPWRAAQVCHLSSPLSSLLLPFFFFFLFFTFSSLTTLIQACSLSRNQ